MSNKLIADLREALADITESHRIIREQRNALMESLAECVFVVETVAHLQGKERSLLPMADRARELLDSIEAAKK